MLAGAYYNKQIAMAPLLLILPAQRDCEVVPLPPLQQSVQQCQPAVSMVRL